MAGNFLLRGLRKTRDLLTTDLGDLVKGNRTFDEALITELEDRMIMADVGIDTTDVIITELKKRIKFGEEISEENLFSHLKLVLIDRLNIETATENEDIKPKMLLVIGVNGAGKTTTIGKLAKQFQQDGLNVMLAAGDTFRAAAVEQLQIWGERNGVTVMAQGQDTDPGAVVFDALQSAKSKDIDILIADTAGRLHTQGGLMDELSKIVRVAQKIDPTAPHETLLVLDSSIGQNALEQARQFNQTTPITGIVLTKLDGTAKGGIAFAITEQLNIPIKYIGVGEGIDDLRKFNAEEFVEALIDS